MLDVRAEMPLAGHIRGVARVLQQRRETRDTEVQETLVTRLTALLAVPRPAHHAETGNVVIGAGKQLRAGRRARQARIELRQHHAATRERVDVRRRDFTAESADVRVSEVVRDDQQNIRSSLRWARGRRSGRLRVLCGRHGALVSIVGLGARKRRRRHQAACEQDARDS
jgi:hypothetical protein